MSNRSPHRQVATFILAPGTAEEITAHGQLVTDPNYTSANRIEIFGVRGDELKFMLLSDKHVIAWHMYENEDWLEHANSSVKTFECGECYYKSAGATSGYNIGKNSIQIIADFIITDFKEINQHDRNGCDTYIFSFLPTPDSWRPYRRGASLRNPLVNFGQWKSITGTNLRFRRRLYGQVQKDDRVFDQDFIIWIPSIEIEKFESMEHRIDFKFEEIAEYINIANMFIYCDHFYEISRTELGQSSSTFIRFPVQLPQKAIGKMLRDRFDFGKIRSRYGQGCRIPYKSRNSEIRIVWIGF